MAERVFVSGFREEGEGEGEELRVLRVRESLLEFRMCIERGGERGEEEKFRYLN